MLETTMDEQPAAAELPLADDVEQRIVEATIEHLATSLAFARVDLELIRELLARGGQLSEEAVLAALDVGDESAHPNTYD